MDDTYATVFLNSAFASASPTTALTLLFLFMARFLPIIALTPFFGGRVLPHPVKVAFTISLFVIFLPKLLVVTTEPPTFSVNTLFLFAKELLIGYLLGFIVGIPFVIVQGAGAIIDHQRGGSSLMVNDPTIQNQSSVLGTLFNMVLIYIFYMIDGPFLFIDALLKSYELVPPDKFINPIFFAKDGSFWDMEIKLLNAICVITVRMASPALIAILMTDVFLGIANRLAPQVQITFLGLPLKSLLGLAVLCIGWKTYSGEMARLCHYWLDQVRSLLVALGAGG